jgi:hypothetical protein
MYDWPSGESTRPSHRACGVIARQSITGAGKSASFWRMEPAACDERHIFVLCVGVPVRRTFRHAAVSPQLIETQCYWRLRPALDIC